MTGPQVEVVDLLAGQILARYRLSTALSGVISTHFQRLRTNTTRFIGPRTAHRIRENPVFQRAAHF